MRDKITEGDIVSVNIHGAQYTLSPRAIVHNIPCQTGDSWIIEDEMTGKIFYISEGCTITLLKKKEK